jgi:glycosyltransferase involved in cell wall biosynthesis
MSTQTLALCIPAYNAVDFLPRLLRSALSQTIRFDEIWVYDDCSEDNTAEIAREFGATVLRGDVNRGCSYGKNAVAGRTSCDWIHFHDADDALYPNFVEQARKWMRDDAPDAVLFGYEEVEDGNRARNVFNDEALRHDPVSYVIREQINTVCGIYRRPAFLATGGFDLDPLVLYNEDTAMHCRLALAGLTFAADPTVTVINYRRSDSMSSANQMKCFRAQYHVMRKASEDTGGKYAEEISQKLWRIATSSATYLDWENADACVSLATSLKGKRPENADWLFNVLCVCSPYIALRIRELMIRIMKPSLRSKPRISPFFFRQTESL